MRLHLRLRHALLVLGLSATAAACSRKDTDKNAPVVEVQDDDRELNDAMAEAQRTLDQVITAIGAPPSPTADISIKAKISTGLHTPTHEHIWVDDLRYEGGSFRGKLANEPVHLSGKKLGDPVTVPRAEVSDWMIIEGGDLEHMKGGFTVKVLMAREKR